MTSTARITAAAFSVKNLRKLKLPFFYKKIKAGKTLPIRKSLIQLELTGIQLIVTPLLLQ